MMARQCFSGLLFRSFGVVGDWGWRGWKPFGFRYVELICFDYRPAVVTRLIRQTPAAFLPGRAAMYTPVQGAVKAAQDLTEVTVVLKKKTPRTTVRRFSNEISNRDY